MGADDSGKQESSNKSAGNRFHESPGGCLESVRTENTDIIEFIHDADELIVAWAKIICLFCRFPVFLVAMAQTELKRQISLFDAVMLIAGDMIGTGIFISTGAIAETLPTPGGVLLVWLFGGLARARGRAHLR